MRRHDFLRQLSAFGVILHVGGADESLVPAIEACLLSDWRLTEPDTKPTTAIEIVNAKDGAGSDLFAIEVDGTTSDDVVPWSELGAVLDQTIHLKIAELSPEAIFIHAGVVVWEGEAIVIPGRSMSGKSTLIKELTAAGATYYSDEFAPILPDGRVMPYPKSLSMRRPALEPTQIAPGILGWRKGMPAVPVSTIAAVRYDPKAEESQVRKISRAKAAIAMLNNSVPARRVPERCMNTVSTIVRKARCLGGLRSDAAPFARVLLQGSRLDSSLEKFPRQSHQHD